MLRQLSLFNVTSTAVCMVAAVLLDLCRDLCTGDSCRLLATAICILGKCVCASEVSSVLPHHASVIG